MRAIADRMGQRDWRIRLGIAETCAMGLCLFFTLSAYLITSLLLRERECRSSISVRNFYVRRVLRIWPLYFWGIALGAGIALLGHSRDSASAVLWYLLFSGNIYCTLFGWLPNPMTLLWSISIEEQFYALWPWAMRWFSKRGLTACALVFIVVANITLFVLGQRHVVTETTVWTNTLVQFEMLATGILLALNSGRMGWHNPRVGSMLILLGPLLWFVACFVFEIKQPAEAGTAISGGTLMIGYALVAVGCAAILQGFCMIGPSHMPRWASELGKISYGLYVYQSLSIDFAHALFSSKTGLLYWVGSAAVAFGLTTAAAVLSYAYLEAPFLRLKRRFEYLHSKPI